MYLDFQKQDDDTMKNHTNLTKQHLVNRSKVRAGYKRIMTHAERQAFLQNSHLGELLGVATIPNTYLTHNQANNNIDN